MTAEAAGQGHKRTSSQPIINLWNSLPHVTVTATGLDGFRSRLDTEEKKEEVGGYQWLLVVIAMWTSMVRVLEPPCAGATYHSILASLGKLGFFGHQVSWQSVGDIQELQVCQYRWGGTREHNATFGRKYLLLFLGGLTLLLPFCLGQQFFWVGIICTKEKVTLSQMSQREGWWFHPLSRKRTRTLHRL